MQEIETSTPSASVSDEQIAEIAKKVEASIDVKALAKNVARELKIELYQEVGRTVVQRFFWLVGLIAVSLGLWLASHGKLRIF